MEVSRSRVGASRRGVTHENYINCLVVLARRQRLCRNPSQHVITATQKDAAGNESEKSNTVNLTIVPAAPVITGPANGTKTSNTKPTITGTGEPGATVTVYDGETSIGTALVGSDGKWSLTPATELARGAHAFVRCRQHRNVGLIDRRFLD